jgi:hypothetical protein
MTRRLCALPAIVLVAGLFGTQAKAQLNESPITPGFWSFPGHKAATAQDIVVACRAQFEIKLLDGYFIGLRMRKLDSGLAQQEVGNVGRCAFNRETQIDHCNTKLINPDGSILAGTMESRYSFDADKTLKMIVTPKLLTDSPLGNAPLDAYPVSCPHDTVWSTFNGSPPPR